MITYQYLIFHFYDFPQPNHRGECSIPGHFQKWIINDATNIRRIKPLFDFKKRDFTTKLFLFKTHDNGTVQFQQGIFNDYTSNDYTSMITY